MTISTDDFVAGFGEPGGFGVFIDDTGSPSGIPGMLVRDFAAYAAVIVKTERCAQLNAEHDDLLARFPSVREFHANEVRRGKRNWAQYDAADRADAFRAWTECRLAYAEVIPYIYLGLDQFLQDIKPQVDAALKAGKIRQAHGWDWASHKEISRRVFLVAIPPLIQQRFGEKTMVLVKDLHGPEAPALVELWEPGSPVYMNGVFQLDSRQLAGLQLADLAAYPLTRIHSIRRLKREGKELDPIDTLLERLLLEDARHLYTNILGGTLNDLLDVADQVVETAEGPGAESEV